MKARDKKGGLLCIIKMRGRRRLFWGYTSGGRWRYVAGSGAWLPVPADEVRVERYVLELPYRPDDLSGHDLVWQKRRE